MAVCQQPGLGQFGNSWNVNGKRRDHEWYGSPDHRNSDKTSAPPGTGRETVVIPAAAFGSPEGARHAAFRPATEHRLRGQSAGFEEHLVLPHEVTCVGCQPVERAAARRWAEAAVRSAAGVDRGTELASPRRPRPRRVLEATGGRRTRICCPPLPEASPNRVGSDGVGWAGQATGFSRRTAKGNASKRGIHPVPWQPPSVNKTVSGFGRLRRPSSQPALPMVGARTL